jgi:hypothetical protein
MGMGKNVDNFTIILLSKRLTVKWQRQNSQQVMTT